MLTKDLWEKPMIAAMIVEGQVLIVQMILVVQGFVDVFPEELPGLPPREKLSLVLS